MSIQRLKPAMVVCHGCGHEFETILTGRAAWYCARSDCKAQRELEAREKRALRKRKTRESIKITRELQRLDKLADEISPSSAEFKRAVRAVVEAPSPRAQHHMYFRLAALSLAAYRLSAPQTQESPD